MYKPAKQLACLNIGEIINQYLLSCSVSVFSSVTEIFQVNLAFNHHNIIFPDHIFDVEKYISIDG